jgi:hypothetical protein
MSFRSLALDTPTSVFIVGPPVALLRMRRTGWAACFSVSTSFFTKRALESPASIAKNFGNYVCEEIPNITFIRDFEQICAKLKFVFAASIYMARVKKLEFRVVI